MSPNPSYSVNDLAGMKTGIEGLYLAKLIEDVEGSLTYDDPLLVGVTATINRTTNSDSGVYYANNIAVEADTVIPSGTLEVEKKDLTPAQEAFMLGKQRSGAGTLSSAEDQTPIFAVGFKHTFNAVGIDGKQRAKFVWLYKVKFQESDEESATKGDSVNLQPRTITAVILDTINKVDVDGTGDRSLRRWTVDSGDADYANEGESWFDQVIIPPSFSPNPLTITAQNVNDNDTGIAITINPTFEFSNKLVPSSINDNNVIIAEDGVGVLSATVTLDVTEKIITIIPSISLTGTTDHTILLTNIKDEFGQQYATTAVNFTTI